jgi:hypothetical protein
MMRHLWSRWITSTCQTHPKFAPILAPSHAKRLHLPSAELSHLSQTDDEKPHISFALEPWKCKAELSRRFLIGWRTLNRSFAPALDRFLEFFDMLRRISGQVRIIIDFSS